MIYVQNYTTNSVEVGSSAGTLYLPAGHSLWLSGRTGIVQSASGSHQLGDPDCAFTSSIVGASGTSTYSLDFLWTVPMILIVTYLLWRFIWRMVSWIGGHFGPGPID